MQITGIILSGGKSLRMKTDKAFLELDGKTFLQNAFDICKHFCSEIIISSGNPAHAFPGCKIVPDEIADCGPIGGIYSCLKESTTEWNLVLSVDAPLVIPGFIDFLIEGTGIYDAVVPVHQKGIEPLIALYNKRCLLQLQQQIEKGNYKMQFLLKSVNTNFIDSGKWLEKFPKLFDNINQREDLLR